MGHAHYESGGAGSRFQHKQSCVLCTEIRNKRHRICSGEGAPFSPFTLVLATKPNSSISKQSYPAGMVVVLANKLCILVCLKTCPASHTSWLPALVRLQSMEDSAFKRFSSNQVLVKQTKKNQNKYVQ